VDARGEFDGDGTKEQEREQEEDGMGIREVPC
jgi:hypothetical protein